jgi:hypothetical protein
MPRLDYRQLLHGQKNQGKGSWSGKRHAWIVGYDFGS